MPRVVPETHVSRGIVASRRQPERERARGRAVADRERRHAARAERRRQRTRRARADRGEEHEPTGRFPTRALRRCAAARALRDAQVEERAHRRAGARAQRRVRHVHEPLLFVRQTGEEEQRQRERRLRGHEPKVRRSRPVRAPVPRGPRERTERDREERQDGVVREVERQVLEVKRRGFDAVQVRASVLRRARARGGEHVVPEQV